MPVNPERSPLLRCFGIIAVTMIKDPRRWPAWLQVSFVSAAFLFFALAHIRRPFGQEDLHWFGPARSLQLGNAPMTFDNPDVVWVDHPHFYLRCLIAAFRLFGISEASARMPGILSGVIAILLIFIIIKDSSPDRDRPTAWAFLFALQYALTPAVAVGSIYVVNDNTVLVPAITLLLYAFTRFSINATWTSGAALASMTALSLWIRISTPLAIIPLLALHTLAFNKSGRKRLWGIGALAAGTALFALSWGLYCNITGTSFAKPLSYTLGAILFRARDAAPGQGPASLQSLIYLVLWLGPFSVLLFTLAAARRAAEFLRDKKPHMEDLFGAGGILLMAVYTAAGPIFGFPRYQSPAFPLISIFMGIALCRWEKHPEHIPLGGIAGVALAAFAIQIGTLQDVLYLLRYTLRHDAAGITGMRPALNALALRGLAFAAAHGLLALVYLRSSFKGRLLPFLLCLSLGSSLGTGWLQRSAPYYVGYGYGGRGTLEAARYIAAQVPAHGVVLAPDEVLFYTGRYESQYTYTTPHSLWSDREALRKRLSDEHTMAFAYSIITNTVGQVRAYRNDPGFALILARDYEPKDIGSYTIWIRKHHERSRQMPPSR